jgi:hypothetical protein
MINLKIRILYSLVGALGDTKRSEPDGNQSTLALVFVQYSLSPSLTGHL